MPISPLRFYDSILSSDHLNDYKGLILLGSYSTADLSGTELSVLSMYGSEDKVLNREKYDENKSNLPDGFTEFVIDGGCHAYFGMYGAQDGDGMPTIKTHLKCLDGQPNSAPHHGVIG